MALTTTGQVMTAVKINNPAEEPRIDLLRRQVEQAVKTFCKWPIEQQASVVEYYDGTGFTDLPLRGLFVSSVASVYQDPNGFYGQGSNAFDSSTLLTAGQDYALVQEGPNVSKCGLLRRLAMFGYWFPSDAVYFRGAGGLSFKRQPFWQYWPGSIKVTYTYGFPPAVTLTATSWATGVATVTTAAAHGLTQGMRFSVLGTNTGYDGDNLLVLTAPTTTTLTYALATQPSSNPTSGTVTGIPQDIQAAVCVAVGEFRNAVRYGYPVTSEGLGDYNYSLSISRDVEFMTVRSLLGPYRDLPVLGM